MPTTFEFDQPDFIAHDTYIEMKWFRCGHEEQVPEFVYAEEADFLADCDNPEPPCFQCSKCYYDTLYRKGINLSSIKSF